VTGKILAKVVEYCKYHTEHPAAVSEDKKDEKRTGTCLFPFDRAPFLTHVLQMILLAGMWIFAKWIRCVLFSLLSSACSSLLSSSLRPLSLVNSSV
jgi:hypothetical protein